MEKPCRKEAGRLGLRSLFLIKKALNEVKASGASPASPQLVRQQKQARWDLKVVVLSFRFFKGPGLVSPFHFGHYFSRKKIFILYSINSANLTVWLTFTSWDIWQNVH